MEFCGFKINSLSYPTPAKGWADGVYYKRVPERTDGANVIPADGGGITFSALHFREKEETGWGVYDYVTAPEFSFESGLSDWRITAKFKNDTEEEIFLSAFCNDILKLYKAPLAPKSETEVSFEIASVYEATRTVFFVMDENITEDAAAFKPLTLISLEKEPIPTRDAGRKPTLFLASDSTVQTYDHYYYPQTGWGEVLYKYFKDPDFVCEYRPEKSSYSHCRAYELRDIIIENRAIGGRSSLSFYLEGKFDELLHRAKKGDILFIQFGHNDSTKTRPNRYVSLPEYKECLRTYIKAALARDITPVLVTPVMRRNYDEERDIFTLAFAEHREKMLELAKEENVLLLDLGKRSHEICSEVGGEGTKSLFLWTEPDTYEGAYKNGSTDSTHLQRRGALVFAGGLCELIKNSDDERLSGVRAALDENKSYTEYLK